MTTIYDAHRLLVMVDTKRRFCPCVFFQGNHRPMDLLHTGTMYFETAYRPRVITKDCPPFTWFYVTDVSAFDKFITLFNMGLYKHEKPCKSIGTVRKVR